MQEQNGGWLSDASMNAVAEYLGIAPIVAYEAATFYDMYNMKPIGKHKISVCTNVSCMLRGSETIVKHLQDRLVIELGETSSDGRITLLEAECLGACGGAPMLICGHQYFENLTIEKLDSLLEKLD